jgi:hypothetical protein
MKTILSLYDESGIFVQPWIDAGYRAIIVDLMHPEGMGVKEKTTGTLVTIGGDIRNIKDKLKKFRDVVFVSAFPPCTHLAVSGARWFESKRKKNPDFQKDAMELVYVARDIAEHYNVPYFIENPVSVISTFWRKPDYLFHPYQYSGYAMNDNYRKKTCLWTNDKYKMPKPFYDESIEVDTRIHRMPPSKERAKLRSRTPKGFAKAVFLSHHNLTSESD